MGHEEDEATDQQIVFALKQCGDGYDPRQIHSAQRPSAVDIKMIKAAGAVPVTKISRFVGYF